MSLAYGVPHAAAYLFLLALFGRSLAAGPRGPRHPFRAPHPRRTAAGTRVLHAPRDLGVVPVLRRESGDFGAALPLRAGGGLVAVRQRAQLPAPDPHVRRRVPLAHPALSPTSPTPRFSRERSCCRGSTRLPRNRPRGGRNRTMVGVPLVRHGDGEAVLAYQGTRSITVGGFLRDVAALARTLPDRPHILNLCSDRYRFSVGFAAALLRGQVSLLPPNHTPAMVRELLAQYPGLYALSDDPDAAPRAWKP
ncbi:MAG: hypothetical protein MZW92_37920 [Comamonadaceae bacterium]|nr:hypothetical protein [Comamonadaceae bacterium]